MAFIKYVYKKYLFAFSIKWRANGNWEVCEKERIMRRWRSAKMITVIASVSRGAFGKGEKNKRGQVKIPRTYPSGRSAVLTRLEPIYNPSSSSRWLVTLRPDRLGGVNKLLDLRVSSQLNIPMKILTQYSEVNFIGVPMRTTWKELAHKGSI